MMRETLQVSGMELFLLVIVLSLVSFIIHFLLIRPKTTQRFLELLLLYQLIFNVGLTSLLSFIGLMFMPDTVAQYMGREACRFQAELANVNLAFGVLGILCIWFRGNFWTATIIGISIWLIADGIGHILDLILNKGYLSPHAKIMMYTDFFIPILLLALLIAYSRFR
jgi:hypothetical protein